MVDIITDHSETLKVDGQPIIRKAIQQYEDSRGNLWVKLSDYFTRKG